MERINLFEFYELGKVLKELAAYKGNIEASVPLWDLLEANRKLQKLVGGEPIQLGLSRAATQDLANEVKEILDTHYKTKDDQGKTVFKFPGTDDAPIPEWRWNYFRRLLNTFETIFSAEMREATT